MTSDQSNLLSPLGVSASQLVVGELCFAVTYVDTAVQMPLIESLIYIGQNLGGESDGSLYFQDLTSYKELGAFPSGGGGDATIIVTDAQPPPNLFNLDGVIDELSRCAKRARHAD